MLGWVYLALAALFDVGFAASMKASKGFTVLGPSIATVIGVIGGISCLTLALRDIPVSVGYPIWVGVGAAGTVLLGAVLFGESLTLPKIASVVLIGIGVIGLKLSAS